MKAAIVATLMLLICNANAQYTIATMPTSVSASGLGFAMYGNVKAYLADQASTLHSGYVIIQNNTPMHLVVRGVNPEPAAYPPNIPPGSVGEFMWSGTTANFNYCVRFATLDVGSTGNGDIQKVMCFSKTATSTLRIRMWNSPATWGVEAPTTTPIYDQTNSADGSCCQDFISLTTHKVRMDVVQKTSFTNNCGTWQVSLADFTKPQMQC